MAVNIINEWSDMRTGIDLQTERTPFSGGSGTLPAGAMRPRTALAFGLVCAGVGLVIGLWFLMEIGWVLLPIVIASACCHSERSARASKFYDENRHSNAPPLRTGCSHYKPNTKPTFYPSLIGYPINGDT